MLEQDQRDAHENQEEARERRPDAECDQPLGGRGGAVNEGLHPDPFAPAHEQLLLRPPHRQPRAETPVRRAVLGDRPALVILLLPAANRVNRHRGHVADQDDGRHHENPSPRPSRG